MDTFTSSSEIELLSSTNDATVLTRVLILRESRAFVHFEDDLSIALVESLGEEKERRKRNPNRNESADAKYDLIRL